MALYKLPIGRCLSAIPYHQPMTTSVPPLISRHVAIIGAGAGGLVAARELLREGHRVVVFEKSEQVGGSWVYTPEVESDPLGLDPSRSVIQSSLYQSLRTNLPREVMGFRDYPFVIREGKGRDPRRFPCHTEVLFYLQDFASAFGITELVRFETEVVFAGIADDGKWRLMSKSKGGIGRDEIYDAVVVCNGHYTEPRIADIPGNFPLRVFYQLISNLQYFLLLLIFWVYIDGHYIILISTKETTKLDM